MSPSPPYPSPDAPGAQTAAPPAAAAAPPATRDAGVKPAAAFGAESARRATGPAPTEAPLVAARRLVKRFGDFTAVDHIDFEIGRGESFGFLGPNGAGKTSTMRMIACMSPVSDGELRVFGMDPAHDGPAIRARIGLVPQEDTLDLELTVLDNLMIYGRYFDLPRRVIRDRAAQLLDFVQLTERARDKVEPLSGGMKRRLTIARSLISQPDLIILDEPTTGLDPQARHLLWDRLYRLKQQGVTLVITTHYMDEAEQLCDRLAVMDHGRFAAEGSPRQLIEQHSTREVLELRFAPGENESAARQLGIVAHVGDAGVGDHATHTAHGVPAPHGAPLAGGGGGEELDRLVVRVEILPDRLLLYTADGDAALGAVHRLGIVPESALVRRSTLEDVFLRLTGRTLVD